MYRFIDKSQCKCPDIWLIGMGSVYICLCQSDSGTLTVVDNFQWHGTAGDFTAGLSLPLQRLSIVNHWTSVTTCSKGKFCPGTPTTLSGLMISPSQRLRERRPMRDRRDRWDQPSVTEEEIMTVITGELCQDQPALEISDNWKPTKEFVLVNLIYILVTLVTVYESVGANTQVRTASD